MPSCLGLYIDKNIIKYAKVSRDKTSTKVEAFGVEVYSELIPTINKIVEETFSFKVPISVNLSDEMYNYFYMSDLLNQKDLDKAIKTEFESFCYEKGYNPNALESRYALVNDVEDKEKIRVIHTSVDKIKLNKIFADFEGKKVTTVSPLSISIANIAPLTDKENILIVNIESSTTVTTVTGQKVYSINKIDDGMGKILDAIEQKENSYKKAYDICKNTTIYTMQGKELQDSENEYLSDIVPTLYQIASQIKQIITDSLIKINKVYLTGLGTAINNIDLYFEELLNNTKCEILKPFFIEDTPRINIKDYIEVNSAIALALQGLSYGIKNINFSKQKALPEWLTISSKDPNKEKKDGIISKLNNISISNTQVTKWVRRLFATGVATFVVYSGFAIFINSQISNKEDDIKQLTDFTNVQIALIKNDVNNINSKTSEYTTMKKNLENATDSLSEKLSYKNTIPVLLSEIVGVIPQEVQITSIENTTGRKIVIHVQSRKYEQLGYFKAKIRSEGILVPDTIVSSDAYNDSGSGVIKIVIEGELP